MMILAVVILLLCVILYCLISTVYTKGFGKHTGGNAHYLTYLYDHYSDRYHRREVVISGKAAELHAFIYGEENSKALVVFAHGIGAFHEEYMSAIIWLVDHGYRVLAPDLSGSGHSSGHTTGLPQSAIDLHSVLCYIEKDPELSKLPVMLFGHSWGSYGVGAALNYDHAVKAVVHIAGYNDPIEMMTDVFRMTFGKNAGAATPFLRLYHRIHFGKAGFFSVVNGLNRANIPALVVQGAEDPLNTPDGNSIYAHRNQVKNKKVEYMYITKEGCANHGSPFHTDAANRLETKILQDIAELTKQFSGEELEQKLELYYADIDRNLLSQPNPELMEYVDAFYSKALSS